MSFSWTAILGSLSLLSALTVAALLRWLPKRSNTITVVVLGDVARSPRMCNHVRSLLSQGWTVLFVGYLETSLPNDLESADNLTVHPVKPPFGSLTSYPRICFLPLALLKFTGLALSLAAALIPSWNRSASQFVLVQNPPSFPTLPVAALISRLQGQKLIIDWHNTGSSILALRFGKQHPLIRAHDLLEGMAGKSAYAHLFVTDCMKKVLLAEWQLQGQLVTFHDRPPSHFRRLTPAERQAFFDRAPHLSPSPKGAQDRRLAVSSTSWTADEDFGLLLNALSRVAKAYNQSAQPMASLLVVITGKGPMKAAFEDELNRRSNQERWQGVEVRFAWLESSDYPLLLGSADFGISLHTSSSGFDLPMKVVDMFGCGLPVVSLGFPALSELVQDGHNGRVVSSSAEELALALEDMLRHRTLTDQLREGIAQVQYGAAHERPWTAWEQEWNDRVWPLLAEASEKSKKKKKSQ